MRSFNIQSAASSNAVLEEVFRGIMAGQGRAVRPIRFARWNLSRLDTQPTLRGRTAEEHWGALDDAAHKLNEQFGKLSVMTGAQIALREMEDSFKKPKAKCPFAPQREMVKRFWGTDAGPMARNDPLARKGDWEKRLSKVSRQAQFNQ